MFQRLRLALPFVPWQDTIRFHAHVFRCLILDAHTELVLLSRSSERLQRLANAVGLTPHDATLRCPPKWRYEATLLPSFALNVPMESFVGVVPSFPSQPINVSHGLYDEWIPSAAAVWGYGGPLAGVVLLWILTLVFVIWHSSIKRRPLRATTSKRPNLDKRRIGSSAKEHLSTYEVECLTADTVENVYARAFAPGPWITEHQTESALKTLHNFIRDEIQTLWKLFSHIGTKAWARVLDLAAPSYGLNDAVVLERYREDEHSLLCQKSGVSRLAMLAGDERLVPAANRLASESSLSTGNVSTAVHHPLQVPSVINDHDVAVGPISAQGTASDKVCKPVSSWRKIRSVVDAAKVKLNLDTTLSPDGDDIASEFGSAGSGDGELLSVDTQRVGDRALSGLGSPLLLSRARTAGHLWRKHDRFDDDEGTGDDPYWMEQVYARLSGEFHLGRYRYGWSDPSWSRDGCEDDWRTRSSQIVAESAGPDDVQPTDSKLRRYSSPCLNVNALLSQRTEIGDGPSEIYVIPQKRGRATSVRCYPTSSPRLSDPPFGLDFLPCHKTPTLLTPTAWKPGCLYISDPPEDELPQAAAWWDNLTSVGQCDTGSTAEHVSVMRDGPVDAQAALFSRDRPGPVSWRDRYENDPASRRFVSVHRRVVTSG
ncbi:hypothetical protein JVU11DRAFT_7646 [Chiua virens]|nr:hypothetical protein JVU11DRAFT_7646 [Chiua virens]